MSKPKLNLIVIYAQDLTKTVGFYRLLGLEFQEEKHGAGPIHYACQFEALVLEIYPSKTASSEIATNNSLMLGFEVPSLEAVLEDIHGFGAKVVTPLKQTTRGRRIVLQDPDGRAVEIIES